LTTPTNVFHTLAMRYSRAEYRLKYFTSSVVILSEIIKFLISSFMLLQEKSPKHALSGIYYDPVDFFRTCIPAFIYVIQNSVLLFALSYLDAAIFQVTYQLKLFTTTIFSVLFLNRQLSTVQWISQVVLFVGVAAVQLQEQSENSSSFTSTSSPSMIGLAAVIFASLLSGFSAVYFEKILKNSPKSLWVRNFELSMASIFIATVGQMLGEREEVVEKGFFYGFDWLVWTTIALQSIGGIIVALVVKHTDNILKGFACSISIIITCIISVFFFNARLSWTFLFGTTCVVTAVVLYSAFPYKVGPKKAV
uniref:UDP-galactose translocator n=1 Tax=Hymenolepis diminuta TaxID=6216 RepID=A0A0R3SC81_HYMDI